MNEILFSYLYGLAHKSIIFDAIVIFLATDFALLILVAFLYFLYKHESKHRGLREIAIVIGSGVLAWAITHSIKYFFPAARPDVAIDAVMPLFAHGNGIDSFPSGHATFFSAIAVALYFYHKKLAIFFGVSAVLIAVARVISGVHFPVDILAGFAIGITVPVLVHYFLKFWERRAR